MLDEVTQENRAAKEQEVPFRFDELFFSRTDGKGRIQSGNLIFQRVSLYAWDEMLGKPHNIVRHPDMPRAVFWLLWDYIRRNEPIGAYVKNRAKDGRHYWVYAVVTPVDGGFLSVRLKPSSKVFEQLKEEYVRLRDLENSDNLQPAESAALFLERLKSLGFSDYASFMAHALNEELAASDAALGRRNDRAVASYRDLSKCADDMLEAAGHIYAAYETHQHVPMNLRVLAAQLGTAGAAIDVISNNYSVLAEDIRSNLDRFSHAARAVATKIAMGSFLNATARLQAEMIGAFEREAATSGVDKVIESTVLQTQATSFKAKAAEGLSHIHTEARRFCEVSAEMSRLAAGLEVTRVMGKVESARLETAQLNGLIADLDALQSTLSSRLREIGSINALIETRVDTLLAA